MSVLTGENGAIDINTGTVLETIGMWSISRASENAKYIASNTDGATGRKAGNRDWTGNYKGFGSMPAVLPGDGFDFIGSVDGGQGWVGPAVCVQAEIVIDQESGAIIEHTVQFEGNGLLELDATASVADASVPDPESSVGLLVKLQIDPVDAAGPSDPGTTPADFEAIAGVKTVTITLTREAKSYNDSTTGAGTKRKTGNLDCTVSVALNEGDQTALPNDGAIWDLLVYVDATTYWRFRWLRVESVGDIEVNIETADLVTADIDLAMSGYETIDPSGTPVRTKGFIEAPDKTDVWGTGVLT